jgi:hypothetical protein
MSAPTGSWDSAFEALPAGGDNLSVGDDAIRLFKNYVSTRFGREHYGLITDTAAMHGWHKAGSAVAFWQASAPTTKPEASGGSLDVDDAGRTFFRSTDRVMFVWDGTDLAWRGAMHELLRVSIQGTIAVGTNIVPRFILPRAGTIQKVTAYCETAPTGASILVDIKKNGNAGQSIFSGFTRITIAAGTNANSQTSVHATYGTLAADDTLTVDIDQVGSTIAGADVSLTIEYRLE